MPPAHPAWRLPIPPGADLAADARVAGYWRAGAIGHCPLYQRLGRHLEIPAEAVMTWQQTPEPRAVSPAATAGCGMAGTAG